jgi:molybdopterin-guanine dinucleotide biosynthesis protein A
MAEKIAGLLLAGGASKRLGRDKARLVLPGSRQTLAENARSILEAAGLPVIVAARDRERAEMLLPGCTAVEDGPGRGPAAALLGARAAYPGCAFVALACDMPLVPADLLRLLTGVEGELVLPAWRGDSSPKPPPGTAELQLGSSAFGARSRAGARRSQGVAPPVLACDSRSSLLQLEPLCALYRPQALEALARRVAAGRFDLRGLAAEPALSVALVEEVRIAAFGDPAAIFRNINEQHDLDAFAALPPRGSADTIPR